MGGDFAMLLSLFVLNAAMFLADSRFLLEHSKDSFGIRSHGIVETLVAGSKKFYPLPQSTAGDYMGLRTEDLRQNPSLRREPLVSSSPQTEGRILP